MVQCKNCKTEAEHGTPICTICNYPIQGTKEEQASYIANQVVQKSDVKESIEKLKTSRIILFIIGGFYILIPLTPIMKTNSSIDLTFNILLGLVFIGFGLLTYKKPIIAIGVPLGLIVFYYLILLFIDPIYVWNGILWKIIILVGLGYGFFSVRKSNKILKENKYLASVLGFGEIKNK